MSASPPLSPAAAAPPCAPRQLCLRCDNRHGCRTPEPLCLTLPRAPEERRLAGRALMARRGLLRRCAACALFTACWRPADYRAAVEDES